MSLEELMEVELVFAASRHEENPREAPFPVVGSWEDRPSRAHVADDAGRSNLLQAVRLLEVARFDGAAPDLLLRGACADSLSYSLSTTPTGPLPSSL